jgi:uncharacterized protein (TIGR02466 family)
MAKTLDLFVTRIYRDEIAGVAMLNHGIETIALSLSKGDRAGLRWCEKHGYPGYTSFASFADLPGRFREFARLEKIVRRHASQFAKQLHWDLRGKKPACDSLWVSVMPEGGSHTSHIHTNSVISGTYYVTVPDGSGPLVFEDPRSGLLMAAPPRKSSAPREMQTHVSEKPKAGTLLLWESWLRHEVPLNRALGNRISVSFNYVLA